MKEKPTGIETQIQDTNGQFFETTEILLKRIVIHSLCRCLLCSNLTSTQTYLFEESPVELNNIREIAAFHDHFQIHKHRPLLLLIHRRTNALQRRSDV